MPVHHRRRKRDRVSAKIVTASDRCCKRDVAPAGRGAGNSIRTGVATARRTLSAVRRVIGPDCLGLYYLTSTQWPLQAACRS
jgi:hypothetical protein